MNWKGVFWGAVAFAIIAQVIHTIGAILTMSYYLTPEYWPVWSKLMMPAAGAPPASFFIASGAGQLLLGFVFAYFYQFLKPALECGSMNKGLVYASVLFGLTGVPATVMMAVLINVPQMLLLSWLVESLVIYALAGMAFERLMR